MNPEEKTRELLKVLDKRTTLAPRARPNDSKTAPTDRLPWETSFSIFNPRHIRVASEFIKRLLAANNFEDYLAIVNEIREYEDDGLFLYALYTSARHRNDTVGVVLPPIQERVPHWYFAAETIHEAIQLSIHQPNAEHVVENQSTAEATEPESRLAYFREDIGINSHHWSWRVVNPPVWDEAATGKVKDRRGELFYYMHEQMIARYDAERLSNGLNRVLPLRNFQDEMEAYFPHLTSQVTGVHIGSRPPGMRMRDLPTARHGLQDMELWRLRIMDAIDQGYVLDVRGNKVPLDNEKGIDVLAAIVEASSYSINPGFYGNLHINGHILIASCHDPDNRYRQNPGVMRFSEAAVRDPIFYRWHKFLDGIFVRHKNTLTPYTREELDFAGIKVVSAEVKGKRKNLMETFMREARSDLSQASFLRTNGKILVKYEHLDHESLTFTYKIENNTGNEKDVTIRVFLSPKYDANGRPFDVNEHRKLMIELDKTKEHLVRGTNIITRADTQSPVTIPRQIRSYRSLRAGNVAPEVDYCTCGWPEHLLIPKGTPAGMDFDLFVMCTDYKEDKPDGVVECRGGISYCGSRDDKYPDKKPMGFPFDRRILSSSMNDFVNESENMLLTDVKIVFSNEVRPVSEWTVKMYGNV